MSPIVIDVAGDGFDLTDGAGGVDFDLNNDGMANRPSKQLNSPVQAGLTSIAGLVADSALIFNFAIVIAATA
jgi:hypothetical protein